MDPKKNLYLNGGIYVLALIGTCIAQQKGLHILEWVCKPLLMITLSSWFFFNSRRVGDRFTLLIQAGLFFSLIGDVALMFTYVDDFNFIVGLGAFFIAQLCYAFAFIQNIADVDGMDGLLVSLLISFGIGTYAFFYAWDLMPHLEDGLGMPVIAYVAAIAFMGMVAAFRFRRTYPRSFWLVLIGSLLFIASDSMLAWDRFRFPMEEASVWIMITYAVAQFLIAGGALTHVLDPDQLRRKQALTT
ncbi:MAG: lysoplasmalogenase [Flavobacteriales bacterium]|nr:lysoplasmalogenase [Flavobacteriales bacterium]MCB0758974.1 lysoplasmalogenase [Flavobacteriales bacterium]